jgi:hypothetical protein
MIFDLSTRTDVTTCTNCQVCRATLPAPVLDLGLQPMCDDLVPVGDSRETVRYPIQINICPACLTAHQAFHIKKETLFPTDYHYRPRFTQDVLNGMKLLVEECVKEFVDVSGKLVCDIGCNDGSLLGFFRERGARTSGIEPTGAAAEAAASGHEVVNDYLTLKSVRELERRVGKPDVITFTNVFAHIEDLSGAIASLRAIVKDSTLVVIENHYLGKVLESNQFDTFYHEHPRTYSLRSFEFIARELGGELLHASFPSRYGGNIRVFIGNFHGSKVHRSREVEKVPAGSEDQFAERLAGMQNFVNTWKAEAMSRIQELRSQGFKLHGKSFPGRASILISLLGITAEDQPCVYEKPGSLKIGHYLPGTRIEILSDERWQSGADQPSILLIWGWHIADEIRNYLRKQGYQGRIFAPLPTFRELE